MPSFRKTFHYTRQERPLPGKMVSVLFFSCLRFRKGVSWRPGWSKRHHDWDWSWCRVAVAVLVNRSKNERTPFFPVHEGEAFAFDELIGDGFAVQRRQLRFVVEQFELAGTAGHEQENDVLRPRRVMRCFRSQRIDQGRRFGSRVAVVEQRSQRERADTESAIVKEMTARGRQKRV